MKKKRGFTLVELLIAIVILGLMLIIAVPTIQKSGHNAKIKMCKNKLTAIFDVVSLWASNNLDYFDSDSSKCQSLFIKCDYSSNEFVTTMDILASQGIISYDNDNDDNKLVSNPINNASLNDNLVKIKKNNGSFEVILQKVKENGSTTDDINLDNTCGKTYKGTDDYDSDLQGSLFDTKEYKVHICKEGYNCDGGNKVKIKNAKPYIYSTCSNITPEYYSFTNLENDDNNIYCYYERKSYTLNILSNGYKYTLDSNKHKWGDAVNIHYEDIPNYELDSILCNGRLCESVPYVIDDENHNILLEMPKYDLTIEFHKKYIPNNFDFVIALERANTTSGARDELHYKMFDVNYLNIEQIKDLCTNYAKTNFHFNKNLTVVNEEQKWVKCYFDRNTYNIRVNKDTYVNNVSIQPSTSDGKYKFGERITLNYSFASGYKLNTINFNPSSIVPIENGENSKIFEMPAGDVVVTISSKISSIYQIVRYLENANNDNYTKDKDYSNKEIVIDTSSTNLNTVCNNNKPANYNYSSIDAALTSVDASLKVIYCYYDRMRYTMTYNYTDNVDSTSLSANEVQTGSNVKKYLPSTNRSFDTVTNTDVYTNQTATYKYEQNIVFNYVSNRIGYEFDKNICSNENNCKHVGKTTLIKMPASNFTITPKLKNHYETYKIKIFLENANNDNYLEYSNYNTTNSYITLNQSDTTIINNNCKTYFTTDSTMQTNFPKTTLSSAQNVVDRTDNTISCYYDRKRYTMTYNYTDNLDNASLSANEVQTGSNVKKYLPSTNRSFDTVTNTDVYTNQTATYKYEQDIVFNYVSNRIGYDFDKNICSNENNCKHVGKTTLIKMPASNFTITPKLKNHYETYKIKIFLENANNDNYLEYSNYNTTNSYITLNQSDTTIINNNCKTYFTTDNTMRVNFTKTTLSSTQNVVDRTDNTISCYYDRKRYTMTYDYSDNTDYNTVETKNNIKKYLPSNNRTFDVITSTNNYNSNNTASYKHGQNAVFYYYNINVGYEFSHNECSVSGACTPVGQMMLITMPKSDLTLKPKSKLKTETFTVNIFIENANNDNYRQDKSLTTTEVITFKDSDSDIITRACSKNVPAYYENAAISKVNNTLDRIDKTINCYYKANRYTLTYNFTDNTDTNKEVSTNSNVKKYLPSDNRSFSVSTYNDNYSTITSSYKHGQKVIFNYESINIGYQFNQTVCNPSDSCTSVANISIVTMPKGNLTLTPTTKLKTETYNVNVFIENANNDNYRQDKTLTSTETITFKDSDSDIITRACSKNVPTYYENAAISKINNTLDKTGKTINCYYKANRYTLTFDFTDRNITKKFYTPIDSRGTSVTSNTSYSTVQSSYKYGQIIYLNAATFTSGHSINNFYCSLNSCTQIGNTAKIIMPSASLTVKPISK